MPPTDRIQEKLTKNSPPRSGSLAVGLGILLSRVSGLARDRVFAHYLGNSDAAGAFRAALRIPNFLQNLFGEGVLSASFIPVYSRLRAAGEHELAGRLAGIVGTVLALLVSALVLGGVLLTPLFVDLVAPGFEGELRLLVIDLVRVLFPGVGLLVLSAWCLGILNSHRRFLLSYTAPVLWNAAMIGSLLWFGAGSTQNELVVKLAWASVVGSFLQFAVQVPFVFKHATRLKLGWDLSLGPARKVFQNFGPVLLSRGVVQLSAYVDGIIASFLGASAVASLAYAQTIYLLPVSLFGMAVAAAELPEMSTLAGDDPASASKLNARVRAGRRQIAFFVIPSAVAFFILGRYVVAALYQTGAFGPDDTLYVWYILIGSAVSLLAATWGRLYSSAFYALGDTRTPMRLAFLRLLLTVGLGVLMALVWRPYWIPYLNFIPGFQWPKLPGIELGLGALGLTLASGFAGWIEFMLLNSLLRRRIGALGIPWGFSLKVWSCALISAGLAFLASDRIPDFELAGYNLAPLSILGIFGLLYLSSTLALGVEEAQRGLRKFQPRSRG